MLDVEDRGVVRWLTLNRPDRKNAIPPAGWAALTSAFEDFAESPLRVLVITGAGGDFSSGADLGAGSGDDLTTADRHAAMKTVSRAAATLFRLPKPTLAAVDGVAAGAGLNLALGCDVVIATDRARFSEIFVRRGLSLDFGGTWLLPRLVGLARARDLALTGRMVDAAEALEIGLVAGVVAPQDLESAVAERAAALAAGAPLAQRFIKTGLNRSMEMSFEAALAYEDQAQAVCLSSADFAEGVAAFLEKRPPHFEGR